jgi:hypothetical protein
MDAERVSDRLLTASALVEHGSCWLVEAILTAGDGQTAAAAFYDGSSASGEKKVHLRAVSGGTVEHSFFPALVFQKALYAELAGTNAVLTVRYIPIRE